MADEDKFKSSATFRYQVQNFSTLTEASSGPICYVRGLPWRIETVPVQSLHGLKHFRFVVECLPDNGVRFRSNWSCRAHGVLRLVSQKDGVPNLEQEFDHLFNAVDYLEEFYCHNYWNAVCDPQNGYIKDDVVILEVTIDADLPVGVEHKHGQLQRKIVQLKANIIAGVPGVISTCSVFPLVIDPAGGKGSLSDVMLECQDKNFNCHRLVLAQVSTTFQTMFTGDFAEGNKKPVIIEDISPGTMLEVLRFIYCGYIETDLIAASHEVQHEFLYAAEKYDLKSLVDLIVMALDETLDPNRACHHVLLADRFNLASLKASCFTLMTKPANREAVVVTSEWKQFLENKELATELYRFGIFKLNTIDRFDICS